MSESGLGVAGADFLLAALEGCVSEVVECVSAASASLRALPSAQEAFYLTERQLRRRLRVVGAAGVKAKGWKAASGSLKCEMLAWLRCREGLSGSAAAAKLAARFWTSPSAARELCDARSDWCALRRAVRVLHAQARRMDAAQDRDAHTTPAELFLWQKADTCGRWAATGARSRFALCYNSLIQQYFLALNTRPRHRRTLTRPHRGTRQHSPT
ncbi:hypothetical protein GNI_130110 [Gregarina niphandrodes]|uniref:Uncharacterized protein n=1 Tax=Gregarina niphandrodes TaxID=110365 RepID=A0A023B1V7_GRENI|nr:hypothetical protein GNI_130110 [Gregarina niphandrodes]EZG47984.1 hypothetical protein GNI_130110 [Gregarina niphandrodes]|eukprot:XP_011132132.1 hypothetical protein GNI_130110 [Gregarina niphandrodes]